MFSVELHFSVPMRKGNGLSGKIVALPEISSNFAAILQFHQLFTS
jgi:hypothetical protein